MLVTKSKFFSKGIFIWPNLPCHGLIDNHGRGTARRIGGIEHTASDQANLHRGKIIRRNRCEVRALPFPWLRSGLPDGFELDSLAEPAERHVTRHPRGVHLWQRADTRQHILAEIPLP